MPFYDALRHILNTAQGKVRRLGWAEGVFIKRGYHNGYSMIYLHKNNEVVLFQPTAEDLVAHDWVQIKEVHNEIY